MSRKSAYALRSRPGGEDFAAAWDSAVAIAGRRRIETRTSSDWTRAVEGELRPIRHRGRVIAWERRVDNAALIRLLRRTHRFLENR